MKAGFPDRRRQGRGPFPILTAAEAVELLGTMQGGYNIQPLIDLLDDATLAPLAAKGLSTPC